MTLLGTPPGMAAFPVMDYKYGLSALLTFVYFFVHWNSSSQKSLDVNGVDLSQFDLKSKEEIKPDLALYTKRGLSRPKDTLKMKEMPLMALEIVSPKQGLYEIAEKVRLYFTLGIQSCWVVEPITHAITVYASSDQWETFSRGEVVDEKLGIRLPISEIFA
jgi:Uma2 family endonuclease